MARNSNGRKIARSLRKGDEVKDEILNDYMREGTGVVVRSVKQPSYVIKKTEENLTRVEKLVERRTDKER